MGKKKQKDGKYRPFADLKLPKIEKTASKTNSPPKAPTPSQSEKQETEKSFADWVGDVVRIDQSNRILPKKNDSISSQPPTTVSKADLALDEFNSLLDPNRSEGFIHEILECGEHVGRGKGVNRHLLKQLQKGEIPTRQELDLHGQTKAQAHKLLKSFIHQNRQAGERCILVITGKGQHSQDGQPVLRDAVPHWLAASPLCSHILAFCNALPRDGGEGALYVLLRKF